MPQTTYSQEEYENLLLTYNRVVNTTHSFLNAMRRNGEDRHNSLFGEKNKDGEREFFTYIPLELHEQIKALNAIPNKDKIKSFCDAGAGYGFVCKLAYSIFPNCNSTGIELDPFLFEELKSQIGVYHSGCCGAIKGNILTQKYDKYDVVYYYSPINDNDKEKIFEKKVEDEIKEGGYIIAARKQGSDILKDKRFEMIFPKKEAGYDGEYLYRISIFRKKMTKKTKEGAENGTRL